MDDAAEHVHPDLHPQPDPRPEPDPEQLAALLALAGVRSGETVAALGAGPRVARALLAMSSTGACVGGDAQVVVAGSAEHLPGAMRLLAPGGRLVCLAADEAAARRDAAVLGLSVRHVVPVHDGVAWSGRLTGTSQDPH